MKRLTTFSGMAAIAFTTLAALVLLGTTPTIAKAAESGLGLCYLAGSHCSDLDGNGYWENCTTNYSGVVTAVEAGKACRNYVSG